MKKTQMKSAQLRRLGRIERKLDRLAEEVALLRRMDREDACAQAVERLHLAARRMNEQCRSERVALQRLLSDGLV